MYLSHNRSHIKQLSCRLVCSHPCYKGICCRSHRFFFGLQDGLRFSKVQGILLDQEGVPEEPMEQDNPRNIRNAAPKSMEFPGNFEGQFTKKNKVYSQ